MTKSSNMEWLHIPILVWQREDLTVAAKIVLGRILAFPVYYEGTRSCARVLGYHRETIKQSIRILVEKQLIFCYGTLDTGVKCYISHPELRWNREYDSKLPVDAQKKLQELREMELPTITGEPSKKNASNSNAEGSLASVSTENDSDIVSDSTGTLESTLEGNNDKNRGKVTVRPCKPMVRKVNSWKQWEKQHKELIPLLDLCTEYLESIGIAVLEPRNLRSDLVKTYNVIKKQYSEENQDIPPRIISGYIEYLQSDEYLYQLEHAKYCPSIQTQDDLFKKFNAVRAFKNDKNRHYDPSKSLTPY